MGLIKDVERVIEGCYYKSDKDWRTVAEKRMDQLIKRKNTFTSEDIIRFLEFRGLETPDMRALGGLFIRRHHAKEIKQVGWLSATRKERHGAPIRVWRGV